MWKWKDCARVSIVSLVEECGKRRCLFPKVETLDRARRAPRTDLKSSLPPKVSRTLERSEQQEMKNPLRWVTVCIAAGCVPDSQHTLKHPLDSSKSR